MPIQFSQEDLDYQFAVSFEEKIMETKSMIHDIVNELERRFDYYEGEATIRMNVNDPWIYNVMMNDWRVRWGISQGAHSVCQ